MNIPAVFLGIQPGFNKIPPIELYNLLAPMGHHPAGSTVSRKTLEDYGYLPPRRTTSSAQNFFRKSIARTMKVRAA